MRSVLALAACSLLAILPSCAEEKPAVQSNPPPAEEAPPEEEAPAPEPTEPAVDPLVIELGEVQAGSEVTFDIPEGALGFNITAEGRALDFDPNAPFGIARITDPSGTIVHNDFTPKGGTNPTSIASFDVLASASVPQGEGVSKKLGGKWKVRFGVLGASTKPKLKGRVRVQSSGDGVFHGGQLDLHIHIPDGLEIGSHVVDASEAESDPDLNERVETFFALTSELLGIDKGKVIFSKEARSFQELDGVEELLDGFAVSAGEKDGTPALHMLMTNLIADDGEPFALGIAPGIPGPANVFGRNVSGIIVTTSDSVERDVLTMIHEAGHFFGLNHTTEFDGKSSDPLSDTPACDAIAGGQLGECPDRANIMFPAGAIDGPVTLSPTQQRVYRGSPIYRALTADGKGTMSRTSPSTRPAPFAFSFDGKPLELPTAQKAAFSFAGKPIAVLTGPKTSFKRAFRASGSSVLSPVERELALGFCGLSVLDAQGLVKRHGRAQAIAELRTAAADADLAPYIRGRANLALKTLGVK